MQLAGLALSIVLGTLRSVGAVSPEQEADSIVVPNATNAVQFRLYLNGSPSAPHVFNTFSVEAYGELLLRSPEAASLGRLTSSSSAALHNMLVDRSEERRVGKECA